MNSYKLIKCLRLLVRWINTNKINEPLSATNLNMKIYYLFLVSLIINLSIL